MMLKSAMGLASHIGAMNKTSGDKPGTQPNMQTILNDSLGGWASMRAEAHLSTDITVGPVRQDAVRHMLHDIAAAVVAVENEQKVAAA